ALEEPWNPRRPARTSALVRPARPSRRSRPWFPCWLGSLRAPCSRSTTCGRRRSSARRAAAVRPSGKRPSLPCSASRRPSWASGGFSRWASRRSSRAGARGSRSSCSPSSPALPAWGCSRAAGALGLFCPPCCAPAASATGTAFVAAWRSAAAREGAAAPPGLRYAGVVGLLLAALAPVGLGRWLGARAPEVIRAEIKGTPSGEVTVVDFVDFECPFCRMTRAELEPILESHRARLRVVRRQVPLRVHPHALDAARAACCGERLGKGEAMANALFTAPVEQLTREGCEKLAEIVGLSLGPYRACVADPKTDERIESDRTVFKAAGGYAL